VRLTVPGNILLLGEYAVLEEGGLGVAMAVDRRVQIDIVQGESLRIEGNWQGSAYSWSRETTDNPLFASAVQVVESWLSGSGHRAEAWRCQINMDSSSFFDAHGRKSGLGSSAAVTTGLVCALLRAAGVPAEDRNAAAPGLAVSAHRRAQGGRGSGYDVTCSFHGGAGIFRGGVEPSWEACRIPGDPDVCLYPGPRAVTTADAIARYEAWKIRNPRGARDFLEASNDAVRRFIHAASLSDAMQSFHACRTIGRELGEEIGVSACVESPPALDAAWCKAVGAGNELGACLLPRGAPLPAVDDTPGQLVHQDGGIAWEE
jgi:phosphomevalonate kinase